MSTRKDNTKVVRRIWAEFESWAQDRRTGLEEECKKLEKKWRSSSTWLSQKGTNEAQKTKEIQTARQRYITAVRQEWARRLKMHKLEDADWGPMTQAELERVSVVLGEDIDEPLNPTAKKVPSSQPSQRPQPTFVAVGTTIATTTTAAAAAPAPAPAPPAPPPAPAASLALVPVTAPSPSTSSLPTTASASMARAANASSSSNYSFIHPAAFNTEDERYEAVASSITIPTDESESDEPIAIKDPELWGMPSNDLGSSSNHGSHSTSPDHTTSSSQSLNSSTNFPPCPPEADSYPDIINSALSKRPPDIAKTGQGHLRGPTYVGPVLHDPDETSDEEADFERFKIETRIAKIWEFHHAAAMADVELAMDIYNDRVSKMTTKMGDAQKVAEHEKKMLKLQAIKEEERREIVSTERKKRRDELRRRAAEREAKAVDAVNGAQQTWEGFFHSRSAQIEFDEHGRVMHRKNDPTDAGSTDDDHDHVLEILQTPLVNNPSPPTEFPVQQDGTSRERSSSLTSKGTPGWKTKQLPTATPWLTQHIPLPVETPGPVTNGFAPPPTYGDQWGMNGQADLDTFPGTFSEEIAPPVPILTRKPLGASKLAQVATASSSPEDAVESGLPHEMSSPKKLSPPKQRLVEQKRAPPPPLPPTAATVTKLDAESPTTPTLPSQVPDPNANANALSQKLAQVEEEQLASTPRPLPSATSMFKSFFSGYIPDLTSTPRAPPAPTAPLAPPAPPVPPQRSDPRATSNGVINGPLEPNDETPWQRAQRLKTLPTGLKHTPAVRPAALETLPEEAPQPRDVQQKLPAQNGIGAGVQQMKVPSLSQLEEDERSFWERTMKNKMQASLASSPTNIRNTVQPAQPLDMLEDETPWQRMTRLQQQNGSSTSVNPSVHVPSMSAYTPQVNARAQVVEGESPWEKMRRLKSQGAAPGPSGLLPPPKVMAPSVPALPPPPPPPEDETPWQRMQRMKAQAAATNAAAAATMAAPPVMEKPKEPIALLMASEEETPWQRMERLKAQGGIGPLSAGSKPKPVLGAPPTGMRTVKSGWGAASNVEPPAGANDKQNMWAMSSQQNQFGGKQRRGGVRKVTMEELPDEEGSNGWKGPDDRLPSNSRYLLDIAEPKPSVPPRMFDNIFQYGEGDTEQDEEEYDTGLSSMAATPSTAPTSPPSDDAFDEDWYMSAAKEMGKGNWDNVLKGGPPSAPAPAGIPGKPKQPSPPQQHPSRWGGPSTLQMKGKDNPPRSQTFDSAKLMSALEAVDEHLPAVTARMPPPKMPPPKMSPPSKFIPAAANPPFLPALEERNKPTLPALGPVKATPGKGKKARGRR